MKLLKKCGCNINHISKDDYSVFSLACHFELGEEVTREIINLGFNPPNNHLPNLFYVSTYQKQAKLKFPPDLERIKSIFSKLDWNDLNLEKENHFNSLQISILNSFIDLSDIPNLKHLINLKNQFGYTSLHYSVFYLTNKLKLNFEKNLFSDRNTVNSNDNPVDEFNVNLVKKLLENGANPSICNSLNQNSLLLLLSLAFDRPNTNTSGLFGGTALYSPNDSLSFNGNDSLVLDFTDLFLK